MAAKQNHRRAQFALGNFYYNGQGGLKDPTRAAHWFELAADPAQPEPVAEAQYMLGMLYMDGDGVQQNEEEARRHLEMAAHSGYARAMNNLAVLYLSGAPHAGIPQDGTQAVRWWTKAADAGYAEAAFNLGVLQGRGDPSAGVEADAEASRRLLERCVEMADPAKEAQLLQEARDALAELDEMGREAAEKEAARKEAERAREAAAEQARRAAGVAALQKKAGLSQLSGAGTVALIGIGGAVTGAAFGALIATITTKVHGVPFNRAATLNRAALFSVIFGAGGIFQAAAASDREH